MFEEQGEKLLVRRLCIGFSPMLSKGIPRLFAKDRRVYLPPPLLGPLPIRHPRPVVDATMDSCHQLFLIVVRICNVRPVSALTFIRARSHARLRACMRSIAH